VRCTQQLGAAHFLTILQHRNEFPARRTTLTGMFSYDFKQLNLTCAHVTVYCLFHCLNKSIRLAEC
tara:strand:+ start:1547 stop:1744 length:198 start_codon:yes stop_codon:yes gene_type:complete